MCRAERLVEVGVIIPGATCVNDTLDSSKIEIGLGIHGEAGIKQFHLQSAYELTSVVMAQTIENMVIEEGEGSEKKVVPATFNSGDYELGHHLEKKHLGYCLEVILYPSYPLQTWRQCPSNSTHVHQKFEPECSLRSIFFHPIKNFVRIFLGPGGPQIDLEVPP
jgi:hypothetical protein